MNTLSTEPTATTRAALLATGVTDTEIRHAVRRGSLIRVAPAAFIDAAAYAGLSSNQQYLVRVAAMTERCELAVSQASAVALHGLPLFGTSTDHVHFTRNAHGGGKRTTARWVHVSDLPDDQCQVIRGVTVTSPARTIVDLARTSPLATCVVAGDAALHNGLTTSNQLQEMLDFVIWHKGHPRAVRAVAVLDGRSESPGESLLRVVLTQQGLPRPELQIEVTDATGRFVGRVDLGYLDQGVLIEFDGKIKYTALRAPGQDLTDAVLAEKAREERLTELGWLVVRVTWADLSRPEQLAGRIRSARQARRRLVRAGGIRGSAVPARVNAS